MPDLTPNRIVTFLTPTVFAPLAGTISLWLAQHFPGVASHIGTSDIANAIIWIAGAVIAWAMSHKWLGGWQRWETLLFSQAAKTPVAGDPVVGNSPVADADVVDESVPPAFR